MVVGVRSLCPSRIQLKRGEEGVRSGSLTKTVKRKKAALELGDRRETDSERKGHRGRKREGRKGPRKKRPSPFD